MLACFLQFEPNIFPLGKPYPVVGIEVGVIGGSLFVADLYKTYQSKHLGVSPLPVTVSKR